MNYIKWKVINSLFYSLSYSLAILLRNFAANNHTRLAKLISDPGNKTERSKTALQKINKKVF